MAARHIRAVQRKRREFSNPIHYDVLSVIATDVGVDDKPAKTGYREIADRANCHSNSVGGYIEWLKEAGYITVEKVGKYHYYNLTFDCNNACDNQEKPSQNKGEIVTVSDLVTRAEFEQLSQKLEMIVTMLQRADVTEVYKKEKDIYSGIASEVTDELPQNQKQEPSEARVQEMIGALSQISKQKYTPERDNEFRPVAVRLIQDGFTVGDVAYYGVWWKKHGVYRHQGKAPLKMILDGIDNAIQHRDNPKPGISEQGTIDTSIWQRVKHAVTQNRIGDLTQAEKQAVKAAGGVYAIKNLPSDDRAIMNKFFQALQGAKC